MAKGRAMANKAIGNRQKKRVTPPRPSPVAPPTPAEKREGRDRPRRVPPR
jgi:hypothetical protein